MSNLTFNDINFTPVCQNNQIWLTSVELAKALGYSRSDYVTAIYNRKSDEFTSNMTQIIEITENDKLTVSENSSNLVKKIRIFSLRGCHLIAMFARTAIAKEFRKWVLDVLDKEIGEPVQVRAVITTEQRHTIQKAIKQKCQYNSAHYQTLYHALYDEFHITSYKELSAADFDEAMSFIDKFNFRPQQQPFFLHKQAAYEFDIRLRHIFDLASLIKDNPTANLICQRAKDLNHFLFDYQNRYIV